MPTSRRARPEAPRGFARETARLLREAGTAWLQDDVPLVLFALINRSTAASAFGAAGSLVIVLVWVYYSAEILLFGAEIAHVGAQKVLASGNRP